MSFKTIFQDTSVGDAIRKYFDTKFAAIETRLESIERMLKIDFIDPKQFGAIPDEPEWQTGFPPENKMVVIKGRKDTTHFAYITKQGFYNIFLIDNPVINEVTRPSFLFQKWREMTIEESALCWERGILGASEEHAELSTIELPIAKQEPEWRPMSTAPRDVFIQAKIKSNGKIIKIVQNCGLWVEDDYYLYRPDVFEGWRPL